MFGPLYKIQSALYNSSHGSPIQGVVVVVVILLVVLQQVDGTVLHPQS